MNPCDLRFDRQSPRLIELGINDQYTEDEIIKILWETMDVEELVMSISTGGFFSHEPVIVISEKNEYVVIEGNRRLAAVRVLLKPELLADRGIRIPSVFQHRKTRPDKTACRVWSAE